MKRGRGSSHGTNEPKGTERRRLRASKTQPGDTLTGGGSIGIDFNHRDDDLLGQFVSDTIILNASHPRVSDAKRRNAVESIVTFAAMILAHSIAHESDAKAFRQLRLPLENEDSNARFHKIVSRLLSAPMLLDGEKASPIEAA